MNNMAHRARGWIAALIGRRGARLARDRSGATAVEFGLVGLPFFALLGAIMELSLVFLADQTLQAALGETARLIRTGKATDTSGGKLPMTHAKFNEEVCKKMYMLMDCAKLITDVRVYPNFSNIDTTPPKDANGNLTDTSTQFEPGTTGGIVVARAYYPYDLVLPNLGLGLANLGPSGRVLQAVAAFRNEPYPW